MGEKQGRREAIDRMTAQTVKANPKMSPDKAKAIAVAAAKRADRERR